MRETKNILIVDDDRFVIDLTAQSLSSYGYETKEAFSYETGIELACANQFDMAILSLDMDGLDDFIGQWVSESPNAETPVMFLTGASVDKMEADIKLSRIRSDMQVIEVLFKPVIPSELKNFIDSFFESVDIDLPQRVKVMAIDDSKLVCNMYRIFFEKHGFQYEIVNNPQRAEGVIRYFKPDLILMDASMPEMDGFTLTKLIKSDRELSNTRIIMVTADHRKKSVLRALSNGAVDMLHKPFDEEVLLAKMQVHSQHKKLFDELSEAYRQVKDLNVRLQRLSITDGLTGLYNHRHFQETLTNEISRARRYGAKLSLLMVDIDRFKLINDDYGHKAGDDVLKSVSIILQGLKRQHEAIARYGGEEFAIILVETDCGGAEAFAKKILEKVESTPMELNGKQFNITVSAGVAEWEKGWKNAELVERADRALYESKRNGRNCVTVHGS